MDLISTDWRDDADDILPDLIALRRAIHAEPELGLQNPKTLAKIKAALAGLPLELREGPSTTGLSRPLKAPPMAVRCFYGAIWTHCRSMRIRALNIAR